MPAGRPRTHDRAKIMETVCERIATGELVGDVCKDLGVTAKSVRQWGISDEFGAMYSRARESQAHAMAESIIAIASGADVVTETRQAVLDQLGPAELGKQWRSVVNGLEANLVRRDQLRVDTLKWYTSKLAPKLYGEKLLHTGEDGTGPVEVIVKIVREGRRTTAS